MAKVYVGMSGGVDSSVTAALLKDQGHDVTGVFMKNWTRDIGGVICPWRKDLADAKRVAVQLDIPFEVFDFETQYKHKVVDYMLEEIKRGRTPNPDVMCNQEVKFKLFLETAKERGADKIATGHYSRIVKAGSKYLLKTGLDDSKDQSYFLYRVTEDALSKSLMPLGEMKKTNVRKLAKQYNLATADKPDSMGICFVGEVGIDSFAEEFISVKPGAVVDRDSGKQLGEHKGAELYTIGQRHGLGLGGGLPYYVTGTNVKANTVTVTTDLDDDSLWRKSFTIGDAHWINGQPDLGKTYDVMIRYRSQPIKARLFSTGKHVAIELAKPARAVTPGQSAVVYDGDTVLGGGIING
ncbi:MAG TPA: tRNA 2-thiouridine(34) synthase MnmA [Candidatus Saccharimonadales bacterium]